MKKIILSLLTFIFIGSNQICDGQNQSKIDSLLNILKTEKEDTNKVNALNALGLELINSNSDTSIILANQALSLSEKTTSKKHIADSYHVIARVNYANGSYPSSLENNFKALSLREKINDKPGIAKSLANIGLAYLGLGDYTKALDYHFKALKKEEEIGDRIGIARQLDNMGVIYRDQGDYPKALDYFLRALNMVEQLGDKNGIFWHLDNIGGVYKKQGDYPNALEFFFKALKMAEQLGDKHGIGRHLGNVGIIFYLQNDYHKALEYFLKALKIMEQVGDKHLIAVQLGNIGLVYHGQEDYPKALDYYFQALRMGEQLDDSNFIAYQLGNIGSVYSEQGDNLKALDFYFRVLKIAEQLGDKYLIAVQLGNIGYAYSETGKFAEAENYLKKAIALNDSIGALDNLRQFEELLSELYDTTGRYKLALEHYKKAMVLKDTLFNREKNEEITRKEMNYEFEKTQAAEKARHEKQLTVADVEIKKQKQLKYSFIGGLGLVIALLLFSYRTYRTRQILRLQEIRNKIAGDLHDDIGSTLNSISIYSEVARKNDEQHDEALEMIGDSSRKIIDAMSDIVWTVNPENDSFEKIIFRMKSLAYNLFRAKKIEFTFHVAENLNEKKLSLEERRNFYLIFKEVVNNLVKYANATCAELTLTNENGYIKLRIRDDGAGFDMTQETAGNGLKNMKRRADEMKAQFTIESSKGNGTLIELKLKA